MYNSVNILMVPFKERSTLNKPSKNTNIPFNTLDVAQFIDFLYSTYNRVLIIF